MENIDFKRKKRNQAIQFWESKTATTSEEYD